MQVKGYGSTDVGQRRENNEDLFLVDNELGLYAVCDGVGGHRGGERASSIASRAAHQSVATSLRETDQGELEHDALRKAASRAVTVACQAVFQAAEEDPTLAGMACTLTLLLVSGNRAAMAHVGDTRLYLHRDGAAWPLSSDHTIAADMARRGEITPEAYETHPYAHALTRGIGIQPTVIAETLILDLLPDDTFLLCSDGLSRYFLGLGEVGRIISDGQASSLPGELVQLANERGGRDNITAVVVQVEASDSENMEYHKLAADMGAAIEALREVPVFERLRFADLLRVLHETELVEAETTESIVQEGAPLEGAYVLLSGEFELTLPSGDQLTPKLGEAVGLTSLLVQRRSGWSLEAQPGSKLLFLEGSRFRKLAAKRPWLGVTALTALVESLSQELVSTNETIVEQLPAQSRPWWNVRSWLY